MLAGITTALKDLTQQRWSVCLRTYQAGVDVCRDARALLKLPNSMPRIGLSLSALNPSTLSSGRARGLNLGSQVAKGAEEQLPALPVAGEWVGSQGQGVLAPQQEAGCGSHLWMREESPEKIA